MAGGRHHTEASLGSQVVESLDLLKASGFKAGCGLQVADAMMLLSELEALGQQVWPL